MQLKHRWNENNYLNILKKKINNLIKVTKILYFFFQKNNCFFIFTFLDMCNKLGMTTNRWCICTIYLLFHLSHNNCQLCK